MPSTVQNINTMKIGAPGWTRVDLLNYLDLVEDMLYRQELEQTTAYLTTGKLPQLTTTAGTYDYTLNQATTGLSDDIWRVAAVLVEPQYSNEFLAAISEDYGISQNIRHPTHSITLNGRIYFKFSQVSTTDSVRGGHPKLRFKMDPGATTTDFNLLCYLKRTEMTAETIESSLPEELHLSALIPAAMKYVEGLQNGNIIEALQMIENIYKPMVRKHMDLGEQGIDNSIVRIEE